MNNFTCAGGSLGPNPETILPLSLTCCGQDCSGVVCSTLLCYISLLSGLWNLDDRHQYPMSNNKDHLVGQLTTFPLDWKICKTCEIPVAPQNLHKFLDSVSNTNKSFSDECNFWMLEEAGGWGGWGAAFNSVGSCARPASIRALTNPIKHANVMGMHWRQP